MSFWGATVAPGESAKVGVAARQLLHLSQACLDPSAPSGASSKVHVEQEGTSFAVALLKEGAQDCCSLDLFVDLKKAKLKVTGKAIVHLTGYFEPESLDMDLEEEDGGVPPKAKEAKKAASPQASPAKALEGKPSPKAE